VIPLLAGSAWAAPGDDYRSYLDQARFFLKKGWTKDAREQLELAVSTEDGRLDPEAWMLLAKVAFEGHDLVRCRFAADRALVQSRTDEQARQARELLEFVDAQFGTIVVHGPQDGATARLRLELSSLQLDPDLAAWIDAVRAAAAEPVVLPYVLGLPAGDYQVNGERVTVSPGARVEVAPRLGGVDWRSVAVEVDAQGVLTAGARADDLLPAPLLGLAVSVPVGALDLGVGGTVGLQPHTTPTSTTAATVVGGLLRAGWVLPVEGPFLLRPSLVVDVSRAAGFGAPCAARAGGFGCGLDAPARQLVVYPTGLAVGAGGEVAAIWQNRRRARSVGLGLRLGGGVRAVTLPASGSAEVAGAGEVSWTLAEQDRRLWVGVGQLSVVVRLGL
jgi:hypothetical protein